MKNEKLSSEEKLLDEIEALDTEAKSLNEKITKVRKIKRTKKQAFDRIILKNEKKMFEKIDGIIGKTFLSSTSSENITKCVSKIATEDERILVEKNINERLAKLLEGK